jgi:hypothetical protein
MTVGKFDITCSCIVIKMQGKIIVADKFENVVMSVTNQNLKKLD